MVGGYDLVGMLMYLLLFGGIIPMLGLSSVLVVVLKLLMRFTIFYLDGIGSMDVLAEGISPFLTI